MDALIDTFHIDWRLIIAQMVNFAIVIIVLYKFAIKPLGKLMAERSEKIAGGLTDAKKHSELVKVAEEDYKKALAEARKEAQSIITVAKKDAEGVREELVAKAGDDAKKMLEAGKRDLEAEKEKMLTDAKRELAALVVSSTEKVLGSIVDENLKSKIVAQAAKELA